ncbi:unnamed protein product, partial [Anisakis simplex]|uniref:Ubiquitin-like domain-containing protein n=1 Tax=Anisakis simplex TaxID=6269 RepID=A0A0M3KGL1_ANISI
MLITFKTISQVTFQIEVDPSVTILDDAQTVEEVKIDAAKFVVVMVARKKAPPAAASKPEPQAAAPP